MPLGNDKAMHGKNQEWGEQCTFKTKLLICTHSLVSVFSAGRSEDSEEC